MIYVRINAKILNNIHYLSFSLLLKVMFLISFIIFSTAGIGKIIPIHGSMSGITNNWRLEDLDTKYKFSLVIAIDFLWLGFENFVAYQINCTIWLVTFLFFNNCLMDQKVILLGVGVGRMNEDIHICYNFLPVFTDSQCLVHVEYQSANLIFTENGKG